GWVEAHGRLYVEEGIPMHLARRRILTEWRAGDSVRGHDQLLLHRFGIPRRLRAEDGAALVAVTTSGGGLATSDEIAVKADRLGFAWQGRVHDLSIDGLPAVDPSTWLALSATPIEVSPLGAPLPPPAVTSLPRAQVDLRRAAGVAEDVDAQSELREVMESLRRLEEGGKDRSWRDWFRMGQGKGSEGQTRPPSRGTSGASSGFWSWFREGWDRLFLGHHRLQRAHAKLLEELTTRFRDGDLDAALRSAIPLGGEGEPSSAPARDLRLPERVHLRPVAPASGGGTVFGDADAITRLRQHYRTAAERLKAEGRHEEVAFVLAELLGERAEAVLYLETVEAFRLAAETADTFELEPELRVRLWVRAGELSRAAKLARWHGAFASAVSALRTRDAEAADALARAWAKQEAAEGRFLSALEISPDPDGELRGWFEAALAVAGGEGARILPRYLTAFPEQLPDVMDRLQELLEKGDRFVRMALVEALPRKGVASAVQEGLGPPVALSLMADGLHASERTRMRTLLDGIRDPLFSATVPPLAVTHESESILARRVGSGDVGTQSVQDAVRLASGRWLLALGERGVAVLAPDGAVLAHHLVAAERLVVAEAGHRALLLVRRGDLVGLSEMDLSRFSVRPKGELALRTWAPSYDGITWAVATEPRGEAVVLELDGALPTVLWSSRSDGAVWIGAQPGKLVQWRVDDEGEWRETYDLRADRLIRRTEASGLNRLPRSTGWEWEGRDRDDPRWLCEERELYGRAAVWFRDGDIEVMRAGRALLSLRLEGAQSPGAHCHGDEITVFDEHGRLEAAGPRGWFASQRVRLT
ncbi:MAG: hypothetical protein AAFZ18_34570, partial [Myxococcota bacterium]